MNRIQKITSVVVCAVLSSSLNAMLVTAVRLHLNTVNHVGNKRLFGITTATMPQTATGVLGDFGGLNQRYGIRRILAPYIAKNQNISEKEACLEHWRKTQDAYNQFLRHNSASAIALALNREDITAEYAKRALIFSEYVAWEFKLYLEHNQMLSGDYKEYPTQDLYRDCTYRSEKCLDLLQDIKKETNRVRSELKSVSKILDENGTSKE